jgi:hypothetical protein
MKVTTQIISKAILDIGTADDLNQFTDRMADAGREAHPGARWLWVAQITPSEVVLSVEGVDSYTYQLHTWSIQDGMPVLGSESIEVEPETEYKPKDR